jgi:hypothetical protein
MSFWCIYRSPLMLGGNLPDNRELEKRLFTNAEVLDVNQHGENPRQLYKKDGKMVWVSQVVHGYYAGLFNISETEQDIAIDFAQLGYKGRLTVRDLWQHQDKGVFKKQYTQKIPPHGAVLIRLINQ